MNLGEWVLGAISAGGTVAIVQGIFQWLFRRQDRKLQEKQDLKEELQHKTELWQGFVSSCSKFEQWSYESVSFEMREAIARLIGVFGNDMDQLANNMLEGIRSGASEKWKTLRSQMKQQFNDYLSSAESSD